MHKRLFVFGCSFTAYSWPTWADCLSLGFDEYYNYGLAGIGNRAIAERLAEANATYKFTRFDTVIVQWSTHLRNDWYNPNIIQDRGVSWQTAGSIFNYKNIELYDQKWFDTFFYEPAFFMHTLNYISLVQNLLENIGCSWFMTSIGDIRNIGTDLKDSSTYNENPIPKKTKTTNYTGWELYPHLEKIYQTPIWEDRKDYWLEPIMIFANWEVPDFTYQWFDLNDNTKLIDELHPSVDQHALWLQPLLNELDLEDIKSQIEPICHLTRDMYNNSFHSMYSFERKLIMSQELRKFLKTWPNKPQGILE
jgi:hypothetical protein